MKKKGSRGPNSRLDHFFKKNILLNSNCGCNPHLVIFLLYILFKLYLYKLVFIRKNINIFVQGVKKEKINKK